MNKKRVLATIGVLAILGVLVYLQVHTWKKFDWATFWTNTEHVNWVYVALSVVLIYLAFVIRAIRWRIFLKPLRDTTTARLIPPQFIGFAGLALLGRPGEVIRPYLIANRENLTFWRFGWLSESSTWGRLRSCSLPLRLSATLCGARFPTHTSQCKLAGRLDCFSAEL